MGTGTGTLREEGRKKEAARERRAMGDEQVAKNEKGIRYIRVTCLSRASSGRVAPYARETQ